MGQSTRENGLIINATELENSGMQAEIYMKGIGKMIKGMVLEA